MRFQISHNLFISFAMFDPRFVREIIHCPAVAFRQILRVDVLMERFVVASMEIQARLHSLSQEWFEESKSDIKEPALIDDMKCGCTVWE
jgi:hypothetical protein